MEKKYQCNADLHACLSAVLRFAVLCILGLCVQTVHAQSKCVKDSNGVLACNLSISLIEQYTTTTTIKVTTMERAWFPSSKEQQSLETQLEKFATTWCETTLGKSRISEIAVFTNNKKTSADVALYKQTGRSYSYVGSFPRLKPSIVIYYSGYYNPNTIDPYLGRVFVHEFSHAVFKIYDEYIEAGKKSSPDCLRPLESDNPRATIMDDHRIYTRYSHPDDYADTPPAQTAQYRCYGESAWEVLLQPERCDNSLSLYINAWYPRQDYFASGFSCSPSSIPSLNTLENPKSNNAVNECIETTKQDLNIKFPQGHENWVVLIDSSIDQISKAKIERAVDETITLLAVDADIREARGMEYKAEKKVALIDFHKSNSPVLKDVKEERQRLREELSNIIGNDTPADTKNIDENLNSVKALFSNALDPTAGEHNVVAMISATASTPSASVIRFFKENHIPIHAVGVGDKVNSGLKTLATETGGDYSTVPPGDPYDLLNGRHIAFPPADIGPIRNAKEIFLFLDMEAIDEIVSRPASAIRFDLFWKVDDFPLLGSFTLRTPHGTTIDPNAAKKSPNKIHYIFGPNFRSYIIIDPFQFTNNDSFNKWEAVIEGGGVFYYQYRNLGQVVGDISAGAEVLPRTTEETAISYPAPLPIRVRVQGAMPVLGASVEAEIITPNGPYPIHLPLLDNGVTPDSVGDDGIYSGVFTDYSTYGDGLYIIKATASNFEGKAVFDDTGIATFGNRHPPVPPSSAPPFQHTLYHQVEVTGTQVILQNTSPAKPRELKVDGTLSWGTIKKEEQTNWYRFRAESDGQHYIQTSNLLKRGAAEITTHVTLYEATSDGSDPSFLAASIGHQGTNVSSIEYNLNKGQNYLVSVNLENNGRGIYVLTANSENNLLSAHEINRTITSRNSGGGGGGGSASYLLLLLLFITLAVLLFTLGTRYFGPSDFGPQKNSWIPPGSGSLPRL